MKRLFCILLVVSLVVSLSACAGMSVSNKMYNKISKYVTDNMNSLNPTEENEFYDYKATGLSIGGVYYGFYYSAKNEILLPDFYCGNDIEKIKYDVREDYDGVYFGKPNNGTDWCFVKKISDNWYYYELHWA